MTKNAMTKKDLLARPATRFEELTAQQLMTVAGGFLDSQPSDANRVIERHELPGNQGG